MNPEGTGASPPSRDETGGTKEDRRNPITWRDVTMIGSAIFLTLGVMTYLDKQLNQIRTDIGTDIDSVRTVVNENARDLAVVRTEITALRRDMARVEKQASHADQTAAMKTSF